MSNHEKAKLAFASLVGAILTSAQAKQVMIDAGINPGSALPSDYAGPNPKSGAIYNVQLFDRVGSGYKVREQSAWIDKPSTRVSAKDAATLRAEIDKLRAQVAENNTVIE